MTFMTRTFTILTVSRALTFLCGYHFGDLVDAVSILDGRLPVPLPCESALNLVGGDLLHLLAGVGVQDDL